MPPSALNSLCLYLELSVALLRTVTFAGILPRSNGEALETVAEGDATYTGGPLKLGVEGADEGEGSALERRKGDVAFGVVAGLRFRRGGVDAADSIVFKLTLALAPDAVVAAVPADAGV